MSRLQELEQQTRDVLAGDPVTMNIFKQQARGSVLRQRQSGGSERAKRARMTLRPSMSGLLTTCRPSPGGASEAHRFQTRLSPHSFCASPLLSCSMRMLPLCTPLTL